MQTPEQHPMLVLAVEAGHEAPQLFWVFGRGSPQWCVSESVSSFRGRGGPKKKGPSSYLPQLAASIARLLHVGLGLVEPAHAGAEALHGG